MMVISDAAPLVLGSGSPRRRDLLAGLSLPLRVVAADVDERADAKEAPPKYLERIAAAKLAGASRHVRDTAFAALVVADTIVVVDDEILGKPSNVEHAARLVSRLVGRTHTVMTRYAVGVPDAIDRVAFARTVRSEVTMRGASADQVERYAATGEGLDKAGAYAVQGVGAFLVERIDGSYTNVVGLPVCELVRDLAAHDLLRDFP